MKVLRIVPFPAEFSGGIEIFSKNLSLNLAKKKNVECDLITSDINKTNKKIEYLNHSVKVIYKKCYFFLWEKNPVINILPFLKENYSRYDLIHAHGYYFFPTLQCALLKKIYNFPYILHVHGGIQTPIDTLYNSMEKLQLIFKEKIFDRTFGRFSFKSADILISVANKDLSIIRERYNIDQKNSYYIPNGVDIDKFKRNNKIEKKFITFLSSRVSYIKGLDIYLKIIKEVYKKDKKTKFLIIGDGPLKELVLSAQNKLPITYYTHYPYENIQDIYNMSKLLLITSRFEGVPNTLYESFACETPVIASNIGGISSIITNNINGFLFDITNYENAINLILNIINDEQKLKHLGKNGRKLIEKDHSWDIVTEKIYKIYKRLLH